MDLKNFRKIAIVFEVTAPITILFPPIHNAQANQTAQILVKRKATTDALLLIC